MTYGPFILGITIPICAYLAAIYLLISDIRRELKRFNDREERKSK
jgi:hypothetical protein